MGFFEDTTVEQLVESNIQRVVRLEEQRGRRLLAIYKEIRRELVDRLSVIGEGTFTQQQMRVTLIQVEAAMQALSQQLNSDFDTSVDIMSNQGVTDLNKEITRFSKKFEGSVQPINLNAVFITLDSKNFLFNQYETSLKSYGQDVLKNVGRGLTQSLVSRDSLGEVVRRMNKFLQAEEWKLLRIARAELHNVYNLAKLQGMRQVKQETLPDLAKSLFHPLDSRTGDDSKQLAKENPIVPIDQPFRFKFKNEVRVFMTPPDRPNDRSILIPYRKVWDK